MLIEPIDLQFLGRPGEIAAYLIETTDGPALFDCGPTTTLPTLRAELRSRGLELTDIRHLLLSHIHLDHAGAAGPIVREHPELRVWVSEIGAPHLIDPSRLESSARRLYGAQFDVLWGELSPIPAANISLAIDAVLGWEAFPTPGHASHHVSYFRDGTLLAGDAAGVRLLPSGYVAPVSPPPDINLEIWHRTIKAIQAREPRELALIHFGVVNDVDHHLAALGTELDRWAELVRSGLSVTDFAAQARLGAGDDAELYDAVEPWNQSWQGLRRYWDKRAAA